MIPEAIKRIPEFIMARRLVWLYFWLLIFEGALRKWVVPGLEKPLLLIRDPLVILIYMLVGMRGQFPKNGFIVASVFFSIALGLFAMIFGHGNFLVMLYGLRCNFLHLPLIFIIPQLFTLDDVKVFGKTWMWLAIPLVALMALQFLSPHFSKLNVGVGGTDSQLNAAAGHVRPSATFSFITGTVSYLAFLAAFAVGAFFQKNSKLLRTLCFGLLVIGVVCSISRSALVSCGAVLAFAVWMMFINPAKFGRGVMLVAILGLVALAAGSTALYKVGSSVFSQRFEEAASGDETGGIRERVFNDLTSPLESLKRVTVFGAGTGAGTNVGASLMTGERGFVLGAELEWTRLILESGVILGPLLLLFRITLAGYLMFWSFKSLKAGNVLPWLLCAAALPIVFNGQWGQPTAQGFASLGAGLCLAATRATAQTHKLFTHAAKATQ